MPHCNCQGQYTTTYGHDAFGNLTTVTDPLSHQTTRHYDADQNLDSFLDGDGNKTIYVYDLANQQIQVQRPDTTTLTTDYNLDGTVQDLKDGKNNAILSYGYDPLARVTSATDALNNQTAYTYDGAGNRLTQQDPGGIAQRRPRPGAPPSLMTWPTSSRPSPTATGSRPTSHRLRRRRPADGDDGLHIDVSLGLG